MTEVQEFMRQIQHDYLFYDKANDEFCPILLTEEDEDHKPEVCFRQGEDILTITDEHVYAQHTDALAKLFELTPPDTPGGDYRILAFRHSDEDMLTGPARTIEVHVSFNRIGYGLFKCKDVDPAR